MSGREQWIGPIILAAISIGFLLVISVVLPRVSSRPTSKEEAVPQVTVLPTEKANDEPIDTRPSLNAALTYLCFPHSRTTLMDEMERELKKVSQFASEWLEGTRIVVRASTSRSGDLVTNQRIRQQRATTVKELLMELGVSEGLIITHTASVALPCTECENTCKGCRVGQCVSLVLEE